MDFGLGLVNSKCNGLVLFEGDDCRIQRIYEALALETLFAEFKERQERELLMQNVHDIVNLDYFAK